MLRKIIQHYRQLGLWHFFGEILRHPSKMGALVPSSRWLARAMVNSLPAAFEGSIVELGPGTGVVTSELIKRFGVERLIVVERSRSFVAHLQRRFPDLTILEGDASDLGQLLKDHAKPQAIISSLPLRSLPSAVVNAVSQQLDTLLPAHGYYIQFTYNWWSHEKIHTASQIEHVHSHQVWWNLPPARVDTFIHR